MPQIHTIVVRERSMTSVDEHEFRALERSDGLWTLVQQGVVTLVRSGDVPFGIRAGSSVGEALIDGSIRLKVEEKSPGALGALLQWAAPEDFTEAPTPSLVGQDSPVLDAFAGRFLMHLGDYLRHGRLRAYVRSREESSHPRGRLDLRATIKLRTRGIRGRLVCERPTLTPDLLCNRLVALGLRAAERHLSVRPDTRELLAVARTYAPLFEDVRWRDVDRRDWQTQRTLFEHALLDYAGLPDLVRAIGYSKALVLHLGAWPDRYEAGEIPASYFLSLESLFEDAVRQTIKTQFRQSSKGSELGIGLFENLLDHYVVDPDIVIGSPPRVLLVADCKYKEFDRFPDHSDVYQLVAHCGPLHSRIGLLVYPGVENKTVEIGRTATGIRILATTVMLHRLREGLAESLRMCGIT